MKLRYSSNSIVPVDNSTCRSGQERDWHHSSTWFINIQLIDQGHEFRLGNIVSEIFENFTETANTSISPKLLGVSSVYLNCSVVIEPVISLSNTAKASWMWSICSWPISIEPEKDVLRDDRLVIDGVNDRRIIIMRDARCDVRGVRLRGVMMRGHRVQDELDRFRSSKCALEKSNFSAKEVSEVTRTV